MPTVSDPILLSLTVDAVALLLLGVSAHALPAACGLIMTILCGLGTVLCLPPLLMRTAGSSLTIPIGPPGLALHLALDPLSTFFLTIALLAGTAIAAFQASAAQAALQASAAQAALQNAAAQAAFQTPAAETPLQPATAQAASQTSDPQAIFQPPAAQAALQTPAAQAALRTSAAQAAPQISAAQATFQTPFQPPEAQPSASTGMIACCLGGTTFAFLAADAVTLALGLTTACLAVAHGTRRSMPIPFLLLTAIILLTPPGYAPRFDTIAAAPIDPSHATAAAALTIAAAGALILQSASERSWAADALRAGVLIPFGVYIVLRVTADLSGSAAQSWWGSVLLLVGGATAILQAWHAAATPDLDIAIGALMRRQAGLAITTIGLALVARTADLPGAATFALEATGLAALAVATAGVLATLAGHTVGTSAGTYRLAGLGGLIHPMPGISAALAVGLLALSALPPTLGFATLWLSFQSVLSAPRTGGLVIQLPLALGAAAIAASAALAIAAALRITGIAILGRPRTPRGAGAAESRSPVRFILLTLAVASLLAGVLPGPTLWLLADPAIHAVTGLAANRGLSVLSVPGSSPTYLALPVLALIALAATVPMRFLRPKSAPAKPLGPWIDGLEPPIGLPFGDPAAQSVGTGFVPRFPRVHRPRLPSLPQRPVLPQRPALPATIGPWLLVIAFATLLLVLAVVQ